MMSAGATFRNIRRRLGVSQAALVSMYERGRAVPSEKARQLIAYANKLGLAIDLNHVYGDAQLPEMARAA